MIDLNSWFGGLTGQQPEEEESAVDKTLRMLQGAGSTIQAGATDLYNAAASPQTGVGEGVRGAVSSAYDALPSFPTPQPGTPEAAEHEEVLRRRGQVSSAIQTATPVIQQGATGLYDAAQDPSNAVNTVKRAAQAGYEAGREAYVPNTLPEIATAITMPSLHASNVATAVSDAALGEIGRGLGRAAGTSTDPLTTIPGYGPVSSEDIAAGAAQVVLDPTNLIGAPAAKRVGSAAIQVASDPAAREAAQAAARAALRTGSGVIEDVGRRAAGVADDVLSPGMAPDDGGMLLGGGFVPQQAPGAAAAARAQEIQDTGGPASSAKKWQYLAHASVDTKEDLAETLRTVPMVTAEQARQMLGDRPDYLEPVADFLLTQRQKALSGGMTPRDVAKAYYMTLMSMRSTAQNAPDLEAKLGRGFVTGAGEVIPPNPQLADLDGLVNVKNGKPLGPIFTEANPRHGGREVRPESAGAAWLWTDDGQRALNAMEEGEFIPEAWERGRHARLAFGSDTIGGNGALRPLTEAEVRAGKVNMTNLPQFVDELNAGIARMRAAGLESDIGPWLTEQAKRLNGIAAGKSAFIKQLLGFGDSVTIDAREINYWLSGSGLLNKSDTSRGAQLARASGQWWDSDVVSGALQPRIQAEVERLRDAYPELLEGIAPDDAAHILHHWLWDKAGGSATRHTDVMASQQLASGFGGGRPTVEVLQERVGKLQKLVAEAQRDGDQQLADDAMDILAQTTSDLADARNARMSLEPRIRSDVGRRADNAAALGPESAEAMMDARYPQDRVTGMAPEDLSGPVSVPVDRSRGRLNAGLEALLPGPGVRGQLKADSYHAAQGGVFGAASETLQAGQEDRETDFGEQLRRGAIGAGMGVLAGRGVGRRAATTAAAQAPMAREASQRAAREAGRTVNLGSGFVPAGGPPTGGPPDRLIAQHPALGTALSRAQNEAEMLRARGVSGGALPPLSPTDLARKVAAQVGYSSMIGPTTFTASMLGGPLEAAWTGTRGVASALAPRAIGGRASPAEALAYAGGGVRGMRKVGGEIVNAIKGQGRYSATPGHEPLSAMLQSRMGKTGATALEAGGRVWSGVPDAIYGTIARSMGEARAAAEAATDAGLKGKAWQHHVDDLLADVEAVAAGQLPQHAATQGVIDAGEKMGKRSTYQTELGSVGQAVKDVATLAVVPDGKGGRKPLPVLGNLISPFFNTPWNMEMRLGEKIPGVGLMMNTQKGFDKGFDQVMGTALVAGMGAYAASGNITGAGPSDNEQKKMLMAEGWRPYSTNIGGYYVPNRVLGEYGPLLNMIGDVHDASVYNPEKDLGGKLGNLAGRVGEQMKQRVWLQGLADLIDAFEAGQSGGVGAGAERYAASTVTRAVPYGATIRAAGTALDPSLRTTDRGKETTAQGRIGQQVQRGLGLGAGVEGAGLEPLPVEQDVLGRQLENPQQGVSALFARIGTQHPEPVIQAFRDVGLEIGNPPTSFTVDGVKIDLTSAQQRRYQQLMGERIQRGFARANNASSRRRTELLQDLYEEARTEASEAIQREFGRSEIRRRVRAG